MKNSKFKRAIFFIGVLFAFGSAQQLHAQLPTDFGDDVNDGETALSINGFIGIALVAGAYFGAKKLKGEKNNN